MKAIGLLLIALLLTACEKPRECKVYGGLLQPDDGTVNWMIPASDDFVVGQRFDISGDEYQGNDNGKYQINFIVQSQCAKYVVVNYSKATVN